MIHLRRLHQWFFYSYFVVLFLAVLAGSLYKLISHVLGRESYVDIFVVILTIGTAVLSVAVTALALLFSSPALHLLSGIISYLYSAVLLLLLVTGLSNMEKGQHDTTCWILRIAITVVVIVNWAYNVVLVNWTMKLRQELEYERNILNEPSYTIKMLTRC